MLVFISLMSLVGVTALCVVGTFHKAYSDNLAQRVGMAGIALSMLSLIQHVSEQRSVSPSCALLSISLLVFSLGVASKVARFNCHEVQTNPH